MEVVALSATMSSFQEDLKIVKELVYDKCGLAISELKWHAEGEAYGACFFELGGSAIEHRVSKITPTKTGQFVTIWKRNSDGVTEPYSVSDGLDFIIITSKCGHNLGQFIFPISVLTEKGIITRNGKDGKRGIRVYPPWVIASSRQAAHTQSWQTKYFLTIKDNKETNLERAMQLLVRSKGE